ncbi:MAG TPA: hypothetical protein PKZ32_20390, partial [Candidatus Melainabacteria bacterium]|nr:hypothetical protein [Candidatus Melainabacteria bacterium]
PPGGGSDYITPDQYRPINPGDSSPLPPMNISGGVIKPEANKWGNKSDYVKAIKAAGFDHQLIDSEKDNAAPEGKSEGKSEGKTERASDETQDQSQDNFNFHQDGSSDGSDPFQFHQGSKDKPSEPKEGEQGNSSDKQNSTDGKQTETSPEKDYQDKLAYAAKNGLPVVVVFGNQEAKDTEKAAKNLQSNMQSKDAVYIYADTNKIDPNSDLGKVIRRNASSGEGLGDSGKSDMSFTGVYTVEKKADGSLGIGKTIATVHGGREEISAIVKDQLQYAKRGTLNLGGGDKTAPQDNPENRPNDQNFQPNPQEPNPDKQNNPTDNSNNNRPDSDKRDGNDRESFQKQRDERYKQRLKELEEVGGKKGYNLKQYAQGWNRFLERNEVPEGPVKDALNEFGQQMLTGDFDGKKLAAMMDKAAAANQQALNEALLAANKELGSSGLRLNADIDPASGKLKSIELTDAVAPGQARNSLKINSDGQFVSGTAIDVPGAAQQFRPIPIEELSRRLAKKSEQAACP